MISVVVIELLRVESFGIYFEAKSTELADALENGSTGRE